MELPLYLDFRADFTKRVGQGREPIVFLGTLRTPRADSLQFTAPARPAGENSLKSKLERPYCIIS